MNNQKKIILFSTLLSLIIIFFAAKFYYQSKHAQNMNNLVEDQKEVFVRPHSPTMGPDSAKVTLVEFLDPECESCRAFYPYVKKIMADFPNQIKLVVRYKAYHGNSKYVISILEAARKQSKFWEVLEVAFYYQPEWGDHHNPQVDVLWKYLPESGADIEKLKVDMQDPAIANIIQQDELDSVKLNIRGTPSFFINGIPLREFDPEVLKQQIQEQL